MLLLPCPFCGSSPVKIEWQPEGVETGKCTCPATSPGFECPIEGVEMYFKEWNKRSISSAMRQDALANFRYLYQAEMGRQGKNFDPIVFTLDDDGDFRVGLVQAAWWGYQQTKGLRQHQGYPEALVMPDRKIEPEQICYGPVWDNEGACEEARGWNEALAEVVRLNALKPVAEGEWS